MRYADRMNKVKASGIRSVQKKISGKKDVISFAAGLPDSRLFPLEELRETTDRILKENGEAALQYGMTKGYQPLIQMLAERMKEREGVVCGPENIIITTGSQQGLGMSAMALVNEGDIVLAENPTYLGAINACRPYGCSFMGVDTDDEGMDIEDLKKKLKENPQISLIYVIPNFQNPTGKSWSLERRKAFIEAISDYDLVVVEDNPYGDLRFSGDNLPSLKALDTQDKVIYLGSFSKILCPGLRVAWVCAKADIVEKLELLKQGIDLQSNELAQIQVYTYMKNYDMEEHIRKIREIYRQRCSFMLSQMEAELKEMLNFTRPDGGMFIWGELKSGADATTLLDEAVREGIAYIPGEYFYANEEDARKNTMRLNFTLLDESQILEGIKRMKNVLRKTGGKK